MLRQLRAAAILLATITLITGVIYPLIVTAVAQGLFPHQANGSLVREGDQVVGSSLIGQNFSKPEYFWGRLSATSPFPYNAASSSGSNFGVMHPGLKEAAEGRLAALREMGTPIEKVPVDLVTASGSGLDPHISPAAAEFQVERVAANRKMTPEAVRAIVQKHTEQRQLGVLGESRVNVLMLNLDLDRTKQRK